MNIRFTSFVSGGDSTSKRDEKSKKHKIIDITFVNQFFSESTKKSLNKIRSEFSAIPSRQSVVDRSSSKKTQVGEKHRRLQNTTSSSSGETIGTTCLKSFFSALCFQNHMFLMQFFLFYFSDEARSEQPKVS